MKAFACAVIAVAVIGVGAGLFLSYGLDYSSATIYSSDNPGAVRLSPGDGKRPGE
ncbi:hypothetical protein [Stappia sp.]|uniref:hypothetical protein n=1 Tax=Stappia sp. TaxID=1870903 RepID=UPI0025EAED04|nr:hypothetical protein [Stappia sp.]|tara:strand:- start:330 stop:494 length:165 start_codon:yes stop_codon:yes gene_type:complete